MSSGNPRAYARASFRGLLARDSKSGEKLARLALYQGTASAVR